MQPDFGQFQIPVEFADYRRRLIVYHDPKRIAGERLETEFRTLFDLLQKEYGALPKTMQFSAGETAVRVVYLADMRFSVGEVIEELHKRFPLLVFEQDARMGLAQLGTGDPLYPKQWALTDIEAAAAWQRLAEIPARPPVTVAIVDSGIDAEHEDFVGLSISGLRIIPPADGTIADNTGHGTMIAGVIGAIHNATGMAGAAQNVRILAIKITDERTPPSALAGLLGILAAVAWGAKVINISWHVLETTPLLPLVIQFAGLLGCTVAVAAGNYGSNNSEIPTLPASYALDNMVVTMASDRHDDKCWFSNYGPTVDLAAPGERVLSTGIYYVHPRYPDHSGTSVAAAYVSAAAALLLATGDWTPNEIQQHLNASADRRRGLQGVCKSNGRLNLRRAVCGPFRIVQPEGGEVLAQGSAFDVRWTSDYVDPVIGDIEIFAVRQDGGASISLGVFPNSGLQSVILPNTAMPAVIRVRDKAKNLYADSAGFNIV